MPDSSGANVLDDLPEVIIVGEILVRLPAVDVFRCRAVRRSWRRATSTNHFMLAHHCRQPSLPIIYAVVASRDSRRLVAFGRDTADGKVCRVIRCAVPGSQHLTVHAALDGLLLVSNLHRKKLFYVCNLATRQCARLPQLEVLCWHSEIAGFYRHHPSGEYRVLYWENNFEDDYQGRRQGGASRGQTPPIVSPPL